MAAEKGPYTLKPIGHIVSPYRTMEEAPRQGFLSSERARIVVYDEYREGLEGLARGMEIDVVYWMDRARRDRLYSDGKGRGVFLTRGPHRPNPLGVSTVRVVDVKDGELVVEGLDAVDGTPVVDLKMALRQNHGKRRDSEDTQRDSRPSRDKG